VESGCNCELLTTRPITITLPRYRLVQAGRPKNRFLFWGTLQGTASTTPPINGNAKGVVSDVCLMSVRVRTSCPIPSRSHFGPIMPTTQRDAARRRDQKNQSQRRRRAELKDSPDHRALINQAQRRRRAELTPSNKDVAKALDTQSRRRKRAERSPEDAQMRKAMDTLWRRRLNSARAAGRGRVLESMS